MTIPLDQPIICPILIGRSGELAALATLMNGVRQSQGCAVLIHGQSGIGKSRLATQAAYAALDHGFLILRTECFQNESSYPYGMLLDFLHALFGAQPPLAILEPLIGELVQLLPDLGHLFPDHARVPTAQRPDPQQHRRRLCTLLTQLVRDHATPQPLLLIVEDVHWCDESSLEVLLYLVRHCTRQRILFLFTYRSDEISPYVVHWLAQLDRERLAHEYELLPLAQTEVAAMLQAIFASPHALSAALVDSIYTLTEGNPFFVEQLLKSLIAAGDLCYREGIVQLRFDPHAPNTMTFVPRSVQDAVHQRVNRLSAAAAQALRMAVVAGRRFDFVVLQQALNLNEAQLLVLIKELIAAQLIIEESADQFAFRHVLIHQALARRLLARERRVLHRTIAAVLEALYADSAQCEVHLADLAYQYYAAGAWTKALEYQQRIGEKALALYAPGAAVEHLTYALEAARHVQNSSLAALYYARGQAYTTRGDFERARHDYEQALDAARGAADGVMEWRSMMALGFLWAERDYSKVGTWFSRAIELATQLASPALRAGSLNRFGNWLSNTGRSEEGLQAHAEALRLFEQQEDTQGIAETFDLLGTTYGMRGDRIKAVELLGQAIGLFRSQGDTQHLISSLSMRALQSMPGASETSYAPLRTRDACLQDATEALHLARQTDSLVGQVFAENALAHTLLAYGEFGPALEHAHAGQRMAIEIEHLQWKVALSYCLGQAYLLLLVPGLAISTLQSGLALAQELGSRFWSATLAAALGRAYILASNLPAAQATLQAALPPEQPPGNIAERTISLVWGELALAQGAPERALQIAEHLLSSVPSSAPAQPAQPIPHLLKLKGAALLACTQLDPAITALEQAHSGAQERNARPLLWQIDQLLGQAYLRAHRLDEARQRIAAARQLIEEMAATIDAATLRDQFLHMALAALPKEALANPRAAAKQTFGGLTAREREVAALIAHGKTSREIAELLVVSERTAEVHVSNILGKLHFSSRAQIAAWAVANGLIKL